ncbi:uncharacterized protein K441DRAFT_651356 [Cenococcum geophilum 1.58]|uniref:uncharacterized protein n=1 Tax=Cenococcum geophilum 1.58 TaxID=794803 RepID=UPI003590230E|nr:hypothetical protein K441DRAFT_651356 [Cenococcum geophilum 1.58]
MLEASNRDDDEEGGGLGEGEGEGEHGSEEAAEKAEGMGLEVKSVVRERNKGVDTGGPERLGNLFGSGGSSDEEEGGNGKGEKGAKA